MAQDLLDETDTGKKVLYLFDDGKNQDTAGVL